LSTAAMLALLALLVAESLRSVYGTVPRRATMDTGSAFLSIAEQRLAQAQSVLPRRELVEYAGRRDEVLDTSTGKPISVDWGYMAQYALAPLVIVLKEQPRPASE